MSLTRFGSVSANESIVSRVSILGTGNTAGNTTVTGGDIYFSGGNNITISMTNNTVVFSAGGGGGGITNINVSAGTTSNNLSNIVFSNSNGLSFGLNGSTITGSHNGITSQTVQTQSNVQGISAGTQVGRTGDLVFSNSNGISFGMSNSSVVTASYTVPTTAGLISAINVSAGTTSNNMSNITFSNSNNVSFGLNGSTITASASFNQTVQPGIQSIQVSNTTYTTGNVIFSNANGISFGSSAGGAITASHNAVTSQTNQTVGLYALGNTTQNSSTTLDARTLSFNAIGSITMGYSNGSIQVSAPNALTTAAQSNHSHGNPTLNLTNINGTTNSASNGLTLSLSVPQQSVIISGSNGSISASAFTFGNLNGLSFYTSNGSIVGSYTDGGGGGGGLAAISAGTTQATNGTVVFSNSNNITFGMDAGTVTASFNPINIGMSTNGNTAGTTGIFDGAGLQYIFIGGNNITLSQSSNGASVSLSIHAAGGGGNTISTYIPYYPASTGAQTIGAQGVTSASAWFFPLSIQDNIQFNRIEQLMTASWISTTVAASHTVTHQFGLFSNNAATLSLISSSSYSVANSGSSISATLSYPSAYGTAGGYTYTTVGASSTATAQSLFGTAGNRIMTFGFGNTMSLSPGLYWLGIHQRQSSVGANAGMAFALGGNVMAAPQNAGALGSSTAAYTGTNNTLYKVPWGVATSTGSAGYGGSQLPSAVNITAMGMTATQLPMMTFISR